MNISRSRSGVNSGDETQDEHGQDSNLNKDDLGQNTNIDKDDRGQDTYMSKDDQEQYKDQNDPTLADELWERLSLGMEEFFNFYNVLI